MSLLVDTDKYVAKLYLEESDIIILKEFLRCLDSVTMDHTTLDLQGIRRPTAEKFFHNLSTSLETFELTIDL